MILHYLDARLVGGIETHVEAIVRAQRDAGKDARILLHTAYTDSPAQARFAASGLPVVIAGGFAGLQRLIGKARPDLLHTHGYKAGIFGRLAARLAHVPVVSTFHAGERGSGMVGLYQRLDEATSGLGLRLAVSRDIAATLPQPVTLIRNFITPAKAPRLLPSTDNFLFAGRLSHEKGPDLFQDLARLRPDAGEWHMIGDGPMRADLENAAPSPVIMDGFQPSIGAFLDKASALVLTRTQAALERSAVRYPTNMWIRSAKPSPRWAGRSIDRSCSRSRLTTESSASISRRFCSTSRVRRDIAASMSRRIAASCRASSTSSAANTPNRTIRPSRKRK